MASQYMPVEVRRCASAPQDIALHQCHSVILLDREAAITLLQQITVLLAADREDTPTKRVAALAEG